MQAGNISPDHMPLNKYELLIVGMPKITFTSVGSFTDATTETTLPDGTVASGGKSAPVEFPVTVPRHHLVDVALMDNWKKMAKDPIDKNYKKTGTLISYSGTGEIFKSEQLRGLWVRDKSTPEFAMENDGEMAQNTYIMRADGVDPV